MKAMKTMVLCFVLLYGAVVLRAQTPKWQWAVSAGGTESVYASSITVDKLGNQYVTGCFEGKATFGVHTLKSRGGRDIFAAKLDSAGKWLWAVRAGSNDGDLEQGVHIAVDEYSNAYVTGLFIGKATFGSKTIKSSGSYDIFVAKLNPEGKWLWAVKAGSTSEDSGDGIAVDSEGNAYLTGFISGTAAFGPHTLTSSGGWDIIAAKLDPSGNWLWATSAGGAGRDGGNSIDVDKAGNAYLTGHFDGTAALGAHTLTSNGGSDIFAAKLDPAGNWLWAAKAGGVSGASIAVDKAGNAWLTGRYYGTATIGSHTLTSRGGWDIFAAKLDPTGNWLWAVKAGSTSEDFGNGIAVDSAGNAYLTGEFSGTATFGTHTLISSGGYDIFAAKLDPTGNWLWAVKAGGSGSDSGYGIAVNDDGKAYLTGSFEENASFDAHTLSSNGHSDIFAAKLSLPQLSAYFSADSLSGLEPLSVQFSDQSSIGDFPIISWLWSFGDGDSSTLQNPPHTYVTPGTYTVSLTVINQFYQSSTMVRPNFISVIERD